MKIRVACIEMSDVGRYKIRIAWTQVLSVDEV